jgi:S1-C subfamily serine protease
VLLTLAVLFAAATILYSALWMYAVRWEPEAELGLNFFEYRQSEGTLRIAQVLEGGPAEGVGLQKDDKILAINGQRLDNPEPFYDKLMHGRPGDVVNLTVERPGAPDPLQVEVVLESASYLSLHLPRG